MDAFLFQLLPDLAFRDVVQGMEPMDIFHVTQTSHKTRCLMRRNARLRITIDVRCRFGQHVQLEFGGSYDQAIRFEVNPLFNGPHSRLYKFGKDQKDWSQTSYCDDDPWEALGTHWNNTFEGFKTIIKFLADTFLVRSVSFSGCDDESFNLLKHIMDRKLPIQKLDWDSDRSTEAVVRSIFEMATAAKKFWFITPQKMQIQLTHFPEYSLESVHFKGTHWITPDRLYALNNCLRVNVSETQLTGTDLNYFLKLLIRNGGRAKGWEIRSRPKFDMETVLDGIIYEIPKNANIIRTKYTYYIIKREDGLMMNVRYRQPAIVIGIRNPPIQVESLRSVKVPEI